MKERKTRPRTVALFVFITFCLFASSSVGAQPGSTTRYVYDSNGRLRAVISANGEANVYEYDPAGNFTTIKRLSADTLAILDFSPRAGVPGDLVTFTGTGFGAGVSAVSFNGVAAKIISVNTPVLIVEVPQGATTGPVTITTTKSTAITAIPFTVRGIRVTPPTTTLASGQTLQFGITVILDGDQSVQWSVNGVSGGNAAVGKITAGGIFTAPALPLSVPSSIVFVRATSSTMPAVYGEAQVIVKNPEFLRPTIARLVSVFYGNQPVTPLALAAGGVSVRFGNLPVTSSALAAFPVSIRYGAPPTTPATLAASPLSVRYGNLPTTTALLVSGVVSVRYGAPAGTSGIVSSAGVSATTGPVISALAPNSSAKGTTVTVTLSGANLSGATSLQFINSDGSIDSSITASNIAVNAGGTTLTATFTVSSSAAPGRRFVIVATSTTRSLSFDTGSNSIEVVP